MVVLRVRGERLTYLLPGIRGVFIGRLWRQRLAPRVLWHLEALDIVVLRRVVSGAWCNSCPQVLM